MSKKRVLVALSGGVDSSVVAAKLLDEGYEVEGATMEICPDNADNAENSSCSSSAVSDARRVAEHLGINFRVFDFKDRFEKSVITPFVNEYIIGRTPNPCIECNKQLKFEAFLLKALSLGFDYIATGHYAQLEQDENGRIKLKKACTDAKDQTYVLYNLTQHQLKHLLLPIGNMEKQKVREYAKEKGIPVFNKPDSQEICFIKDNDYARFIANRGYIAKSGNFVDLNGNILGKHKGIYHYTIGQRKGLGIALGKPAFVTKIDTAKNEVTLGDNNDTFQNSLTARDMNWISFDTPPESFDCLAKIRYNGPPEKATVFPQTDGSVKVEFHSPVRAVTPGQSVVFYADNFVIGGGKID